MGYLSSGMVSTWMATCQFHSNCASLCFELQLGCCYGAISLYNINETAIAPRRSIWSLMSRLEHRRWFGKWSFPNLCCWFWCLAWSIGFGVLPSILLWYDCCLNFAQSPPWHRRMVWTVCICLYCCHISLVKSNVSISGCFPGRRIQSASPFKFPSRRVTLPYFGSEGRGWVLHIDVVIWHVFFLGTLILKAYWSGYGMNEDFSLKLPIEGFEHL